MVKKKGRRTQNRQEDSGEGRPQNPQQANVEERPRDPQQEHVVERPQEPAVERPQGRQQAKGERPKTEPSLEEAASKLSLIPQNPPPIEFIHSPTQAGMKLGTFARPFANIDERMKHVGKEGKPVTVLANHFSMNVLCEAVHRYEVDWSMPWTRPIRNKDKPLLYRAIEQLKMEHKKTVFCDKPAAAVFDGNQALYTAFKLRLGSNAGTFEATVKLAEVEDIPERMVDIGIKLKYVATAVIREMLDNYSKRGSRGGCPNEAVSILNVILGYTAQTNADLYIPIGRKYFSTEARAEELGNGKSLWFGTFLSARAGWKIRLNVDMANKPGYDKGSLPDFISGLFPQSRDSLENILSSRENLRTASDAIKDLKVRFLRPDGQKRDYRATKLVETPDRLKVTVDIVKNGAKAKETMTICKYFKQTYNYNPNSKLPCLNVGNPDRKIFLPLECLELKTQACPNSKKLTQDETRNMIKATAVKPNIRKERIQENLKQMHNGFKNDPHAKAFGITVDDKFTKINARVLKPPEMAYTNTTDKITQTSAKPGAGKWKLPQKSGFVRGQPLLNWGVLDLSGSKRQAIDVFIKMLSAESRNMGMKVVPPKDVIQNRNDDTIQSVFRSLYQRMSQDPNTKPQIVVVIVFGSENNARDKLKLIGDTELGVPTQFVLVKNAVPRPNPKNPTGLPSHQTIHNICLKVNSKLGGTNQALAVASKLPMFNTPIMFMGADVTHPPPDQLGSKPSIAAVVGSIDPRASIYNCEIRVQYGGQVVEEIIEMEAMTKNLLMKFFQQTNGKHKPQRIIFYRDGVSEGQFAIVLNKELSAIQRACRSMEKDYEPKITFIVAQKRHNTRLFPDRNQYGNVEPGTVVDTDITHPTETNFFLASHEGIQGTTRPTGYHVLSDDNDLDSDTLQKLTFFLCHLYSRCERSVSYPAPTYYAHLAAFRAREHHNALIDQGKGSEPEALSHIQNVALKNYFI